MNVQEVGTRGFFFTFDDPYLTNLYVINGERYLFICDTFLGPDPMKEVLKYLKKRGFTSKPKIVFNSHHDYDHIWGNQCFKDSIILAHELCKKKIEDIGEEDLKEFKSHLKGKVELILPNVTFTDKVLFEDEGVEFYYTPGHTEDSSSCFDQIDEVLFVGDNIESPLPYLRKLNVDEYIQTLEEYLARKAIIVLSGHDEIMFTDELIKNNLIYLKNFSHGKTDRSSFTKKQSRIHYSNLKTIADWLKEQNKKKEALEYYKEAKQVLEEAEQTDQLQDLLKEIQQNIDDLSK